MSNEISQFFGRAHEFVDLAREVIEKHYRAAFDTKIKSDNSPVTEIDLAVETTLRQAIARTYPDHGIIGEEFPHINPNAEYQWIIDPIDGTQNLVHRIATFGTILGLFKSGAPVVGVIDCPLLDYRVAAANGVGTFVNRQRVSFDPQNDRPLGPQDVIACSAPITFARSRDCQHVFRQLCAHHLGVRIYYDCYAHALAAAGSLAAHIEYNVRIWDIAASQILIEQAGGSFEIVDQYEDDGAARYSIIMGRKAVVAELAPMLKRWNREATQCVK